MAQIIINKGDTLGALASKYGTTVESLVASNKGNAAVKSANLIIAGGNLNVPDTVGAPAAGVAQGAGTPVSGALDAAKSPQAAGAMATSELGNLRVALRSALNEAGASRMASQYSQIAPLAGGVPGTLGSVVNMIRSNVQAPVESVFGDITTAWREDMAAQDKEKARIQELRIEFGSAIPSTVTSLDEAIGYVTPLVDKENNLRLAKLQEEQAVDNDVDTWARYIVDGGSPTAIKDENLRTKALARSQVIINERETKAKQEYIDGLKFDKERGKKTYEDLRQKVINQEGFTYENRNEMINYIDKMEADEKAGIETQKTQASNESIYKATNPLQMLYGVGKPS